MNASLIPENAGVADIGCDHGYVSIYLTKEKGCRVIAMDVREGPLSIARQNIQRAQLAEQIECRLSDGIMELLPGEADTLLLGGMGGMLIVSILQKRPDVMEKVETVVLQPQSDWHKVRQNLLLMGFVIDREAFCVDAGKDYLAIRGRRPKDGRKVGEGRLVFENCTEAELSYGRYLSYIREENYHRYLLREQNKYIKIRKNLTGKSGNALGRIEEITHILDMLEETLRLFRKPEEIRGN